MLLSLAFQAAASNPMSPGSSRGRASSPAPPGVEPAELVRVQRELKKALESKCPKVSKRGARFKRCGRVCRRVMLAQVRLARRPKAGMALLSDSLRLSTLSWARRS